MPPSYDPRYLKYFEHFGQGDYFEAHEVLEALWLEDHSESRDFYKGLIQAAVTLHHIETGNRGGAKKVHRTAVGYLKSYEPTHLGLDVTKFVSDFTVCLDNALSKPDPITLDPTTVPRPSLKLS